MQTHLLKDPKVKRLVLYVITALCLVAIIAVFICHNIAENRRIDAEAITLKDNLNIAFGKEAKVSDFLEHLNGELINDPRINTDELGETEVIFEYKNIKNKQRTGRFKVNVIDVTPPRIYGLSAYTVETNYAEDLTNLMLSGDDLDDHPKREIIGEYDLSEPGSYDLDYLVVDASGNESKKSFVLNVVAPTSGSSVNKKQASSSKLAFSDVVKEYKTAETKVGIDVSNWQGNINWEKVKNAGAEFAIIRVGYQYGYDGENILDKRFVENIEGALAVGLPAGVYFYSYARSIDQAIEQAEWVKTQIEPYSVTLGVAFDWENWSEFNEAGISFLTLNLMAKAFLGQFEELGLKGFIYGSKNYLDLAWQIDEYETWLAQYYDHVTYTKKYRIWQLSDTGRIDGITTDVDIDIMYLDPENK